MIKAQKVVGGKWQRPGKPGSAEVEKTIDASALPKTSAVPLVPLNLSPAFHQNFDYQCFA
jgi:hypothetical protein